MKILYVTTISNTVNAFLIPHINMLLEEGHEVSVACSLQQPLDSFFNENNISIYNIPFNRSPFSRNNHAAYKEFKSLVENEKFDIVHTHTPIASMIVRLACKNISTKVVYTAHGFHFFKGAPLKNWLVYYPIEKICARKTDNIITINNEDYNLAKSKLHAGNVSYVHGVGLPTEKFQNIIPTDLSNFKNFDDDCVILSIGELNNNKNHEQVIIELEKIREEHFIYLICGVGEEKDGLEKLIAEKKLSNKIYLLGYRKDIPNILSASDVYIHPSKREGLPVSVMEAMFTGLPICCSNIRGNKDLVQHEENGYLVNLNDTSKNFAFYLSKFFNNKELAERMGESSKKLIEPFLEANVLPELKEIYSSLGIENK